MMHGMALAANPPRAVIRHTESSVENKNVSECVAGWTNRARFTLGPNFWLLYSTVINRDGAIGVNDACIALA
jgi:hypothetical protein